MKILFEEFPYETKDVRNILCPFALSEAECEASSQQLKMVGYFFNKNIVNKNGTTGDLVFILPKVLLDKKDDKLTLFGLDPGKEDIINFNFEDWKKNDEIVPDSSLSKRALYDFIYGFAVWIYRAVDIYRRNQKKKKQSAQDDLEAEVMTSLKIGESGRKSDSTFMDVLLSLLDFQRTHRDFITFVIKMAHSGHNKISWTKTISRSQAIVQDNVPIYLDPVNKKRYINFDEELLVIYYSILNYIHEEYGFPLVDQPGYKLIQGAMFRGYMKNLGKTRLRQIRYKYYNDDAILLWNLCFAFFDKSDHLKANADRRDFLLIKKFETVFEAMIDELIGDKNLPDGLKVAGDDKRIDHIYTYKYLIENVDGDYGMDRSIYNIADSKYYRRDKSLQGHDVPKQFTYARNVIQWHMDLLHGMLYMDKTAAERKEELKKANDYNSLPLYDKITEGFNIIPNFFVSASVDDQLRYDSDGFGRSTLKNSCDAPESFIFWERLFDRNTYFTLHYDVNFLYVLRLYAQNRKGDQSVWREKVKADFREKTLEHLNKEFRFYQVLLPSGEIPNFVERHYRKIIGKVFSFDVDTTVGKVLIYAERSSQSDGEKNSDVSDSHVSACGKTLIVPALGGATSYYPLRPLSKLGSDGYVKVEDVANEFILVGYYKQAQLESILSTKKYNIRASGKDAVLTAIQAKAKYLVLHNATLGTRLMSITSSQPYMLAKDEIPVSGKYKPTSSDFYFVYDVEVCDEESELRNLIMSDAFINRMQSFQPKAFKLEELKTFARTCPIVEINSQLDKETFARFVADESEFEYKSKTGN